MKFNIPPKLKGKIFILLAIIGVEGDRLVLLQYDPQMNTTVKPS